MHFTDQEVDTIVRRYRGELSDTFEDIRRLHREWKLQYDQSAWHQRFILDRMRAANPLPDTGAIQLKLQILTEVRKDLDHYRVVRNALMKKLNAAYEKVDHDPEARLEVQELNELMGRVENKLVDERHKVLNTVASLQLNTHHLLNNTV